MNSNTGQVANHAKMPSPSTSETQVQRAPANSVETMSMERIDFLLARAEATLRAAAANQKQARPPEQDFSRVTEATSVDAPLAAPPTIIVPPAGPTVETLEARRGSRGGYVDDMRRMAGKGKSTEEIVESKPGMKAKGAFRGPFISPTLAF